MSTESESKSISTVPKWDGKVESCAMYLAQISALAEYHDCGDAMDGMMMVDCPTKSEFDALQPTTTDPDEKRRRKLYLANKRILAIMTLGMTSSHGLAVIQKTASADFPQGKAYRVVEILKQKCKPSDVSAEIELDQELEKVKFGNAIDFYNDIIGVTARYEVTKSDIELIKIMAKKCKNPLYANMILQHLAGTAHDFEAICETIGKVQRLAKGPGDAPRGDGRREKEVHLASAENGSGDFNGVCGYCKKKAGHKRKDCPVRKAKQSGSGSGSGSGKKCSSCGKDGHSDTECWKKFPDKAPKWYKDLSKKGEAAGSSVEVVLATVDVPNSNDQDFHGACL
jgi:hypothetical protein